MAAPAIFKRQIAAERSLAVVAGETSHAARNGKVFKSRRGTDLTRLRRAGRELMALGAGKPLAWAVLRVAKRVAKGARVR
ncbi:MAG: hypothetical protein M3R69_00060 [Acidobacteriota bacterium]|nr:hypothetical protein [Acidobacteriota bacterium]